MSGKRIYDVSMNLRTGGVVYPGNPVISITAQQAISQGAGANVSRVDFGSHTGTHVDAPKHFFDDGALRDGLLRGDGDARIAGIDHSARAQGHRDIVDTLGAAHCPFA
jgi:hypothetical protein